MIWFFESWKITRGPSRTPGVFRSEKRYLNSWDQYTISFFTKGFEKQRWHGQVCNCLRIRKINRKMQYSELCLLLSINIWQSLLPWNLKLYFAMLVPCWLCRESVVVSHNRLRGGHPKWSGMAKIGIITPQNGVPFIELMPLVENGFIQVMKLGLDASSKFASNERQLKLKPSISCYFMKYFGFTTSVDQWCLLLEFILISELSL